MNPDTPDNPRMANDPLPTKSPRRNLSMRLGRVSSYDLAPGAMLRLTRQQRILLREGMADLRELFRDAEVWEQAADDALNAQNELDIPNLGAVFCMWTSSMAALTHGAWWLLMPGCGAPVLQNAICSSLACPFLERKPDYAKLSTAIDNGKYPALAQVIETTERVRCMIAIRVRTPN